MTIFWPVTPLPDESLAGLVARAAGVNIYPHAHDILVLAGLGSIRPETIAGKSPETANALAEVLGTSPDLLRHLYHPAIDDRLIDFFGTPLRAKHRETRLRRVSPMALRDKTYIRAAWSVRPLTFDPQTKEALLSECPVCKGKLGFTRTWGVQYCEHCIGNDPDGLPQATVDLRDFPQPIVQVDDGEALDFVVGLIDPQWGSRLRPSVHDDLSCLNRGELFEMALALAAAIVTEDEGLQVNVESSSRLPVEITPRALSEAGRCIMNWPNGFTLRCRSATKNAHQRDGQWGLFKEFGAFAQLRKDEHLHLSVREAISARLEGAMADFKPNETIKRKTTRTRAAGTYIGVRQLLREVPVSSKITTRLGAHPDMITYRHSDDPMAPVLFHAWQAKTVLAHYQDLLSEAALGVILGLPPDAIRDIAAKGYIENVETTSRNTAMDLLGGGTHYSKAGVGQFVDAIAHGMPFQKPPKGYISFAEAMLMFPAGRRPWLQVIEAITWGRVDAVFRRNVAAQPKIRDLFGSVSLRGIEQHRNRILADHAGVKDHDIGRVSAVAANLMLGIYNHQLFMNIAVEKLIDVDDDGADYQSVLAFSREYILANETAVRSRNSGSTVQTWLKARQVVPAYEFEHRGGVVYHRDEVEPWLEMKV